jgi:hypothetical protein
MDSGKTYLFTLITPVAKFYANVSFAKDVLLFVPSLKCMVIRQVIGRYVRNSIYAMRRLFKLPHSWNVSSSEYTVALLPNICGLVTTRRAPGVNAAHLGLSYSKCGAWRAFL